ncbi:neutral zinc metallopeptidase [Streptosporangium amethystogenes]|uniref:neutral zinc metallopeptidase n=1 Tax=Streptosporangium amethystogenes TaxID=2002 RepID=UPI0037A9205A
MRTFFTLLMAGVLASMPLTGTASAESNGPVPAGTTAFTKNPIYKTGELKTRICEEPTVRGGDFDSVEIYVNTIAACLDRAWEAQLKKAGIAYGKPKVKAAYGSRIKTACGTYRPGDTFSLYCQKNSTIYLMVTDYGVLDEIDDPRMLESLAIGYGYHVQRLVGVLAQESRAARKLSKAGALALSAKISLQNICLAGTFIGSVWDSLGHTKVHGYDFIIDRHRIESGIPGNGTTKNRLYWERRGFETRSPGACNTFTAPAARVT